MTSVASISSGFSFRRVWEFATYYMPRLKGELLIYAAISLVCSILCVIPASGDVQMTLFVGSWTILPIIFYCGPLIFAKGPDTRIVERLLPVSAAEKMTFYYIYIMIVIPFVVFLLPLCSYWIYISLPSLQTPEVLALYDTKFNLWGVVWIINTVGGAFIAMACFLGVEYARQNRMLFGIVAVIVANVIIGILGAIIGIAAAIKGFRMGLCDGLAGKTPDADRVAEELVSTVMNDLNTFHPLSIAILVLLIVMVFTTGWFTYRAIRSRNL